MERSEEVGVDMARILVIDDNADILELLSRVLANAGYEVITASNALEGLQIYRADPADVIIMDIIMPGTDGWDAITELRRDFPRAKIIAMSGGGPVGPYSYLMIASQLGANAVFAKPVKRHELLNTVEELLDSHQPHG
jgi:CheY-like chemotaxis protein